MFASKTPSQAGFEPRPYRFYFSGKATAHPAGDHTYLDIENQWYGLQSNDPNPILAYARHYPGMNIMYDKLPHWPSDAQIEHAHKVLQRLARLRVDKHDLLV